MEIKFKDLRRLIRETFAREIPGYVVDEIYTAAIKKNPKDVPEYCKEKLQHYFLMHINSTSSSKRDMQHKIVKMQQVLNKLDEEINDLKSLKDELKNVIEQSIQRFLFI